MGLQCVRECSLSFAEVVPMLVTKTQLVSFPAICLVIKKLTAIESASFYQCLAFATVHLTILLARVTAGATFDRIPMMYMCLALTINWLFQAIWFAIEYKKMKAKLEHN